MLAIACLIGVTAGAAQADPLNLRPKFSTSELSELEAAFDSITKDGDYDIDSDRAETRDLAPLYPAKVKELEEEYRLWKVRGGL